jgi:hypothetical protein
MQWPESLPFSIKNDQWINTAKYVNMKDMKWEAIFAITFAIAEGDYTGAEEVAFAWIDNDYMLNKLNMTWEMSCQIAVFLKDWHKFTVQAKPSDILPRFQSWGSTT